MKPIKRVYSHKITYFSSAKINIGLPAGQPGSETNCKEPRQPNVEQADAFAKLLWDETACCH